MNKTISFLLVSFFINFSLITQAWALDLDMAKQKGWVGEQRDGYLGVITPNSDINALISDINEKRNAAYERIAKKNGISPKKVGKLAGEKLIRKLKAGEYYQSAEGKWLIGSSGCRKNR